MDSSEPPPPLSAEEESAVAQDEMNADETDLNKLEETEAAVMSLLASEADNDEAIEQSQALLTVSESYSGIGDSDEFPVKEASSRTSPQDSESGMVDAAFNEATVKLSEGLSSLVSYSSSSAEVSASEDNGQDDPENDVDEAAPRVEGTVQFVEAAESGSEKLAEEVQQESSLVSPGEVLAAAADALASAADIEQVHVEEAEAVDNMAAALVKASSSMALNTDLATMDVEEPAITEVMNSDQEEKTDVQTPVFAEEGNVTQAHPAQEREASTEECVQESKDEVESLQNLAKETVQEELVTAFDEETQAAEKKDEVDFKKGSLETENAPEFVKESKIQKSPQDTEHESFADPGQASVPKESADIDTEVQMKKDAVENPPAEYTPSVIDSTQTAKLSPENLDMNPTEKELVSHEKDVNKGKGIKRSLEEDTEEPVESHEMQEEKRLRKSEQAMSPSPQTQVEREEQEEEQDTLQEEEAEPMETEAPQELEPESSTKTQAFDLSVIAKADDGSREGEGEEVGEDEGEKKDNDIQEKDKDDGKEDEESSTPSRKRKKKKRSYERPRGEGGKFMKEKPDPSMLDEETRMDYNLPQDEDSQGSASRREVRRFRCEVIVPESTEVFTAEKVVEYVWPLEGVGEHYFIQEQISQYLGIMSFKRRYPDLRRRPIDMQERDYLKEKGLVSDMACDLGLTAVRSEDVLDVMFNDFPAKFEELQRLLRERKENEMRERGKVNYSMANIDKSKMQEYGRKAAADAARWNANFNKEKREERRYSFDLQTFTLQMPAGRGKKLPPAYTKIGFYPVAVLPGQFTNHYREYSSQALKTMPLTTIMSAPVIADQLGSDGGSSDSEDETCDTQRAVLDDNGKEEKGGDGPRCKVCNGTKNRNKGGKPEPLIICGSCKSASHPTCIDLTLVMVPKIESYNWQCMDCKTCVTCNDPDDEDKMIFCDMCDRGYHIYCVGLRRVPNGRWHCKECAMCSSCGSKTPAGNEHLKNAEWQHEFKKDKDNKQLRYATTLCVPCDKYWKRRQFCYVCLKVYRSIPEDGMVRCSNCPKYIHREVCSTMYENERFCINCFKMRNSTALNHSRIIAAAKKKMASGY